MFSWNCRLKVWTFSCPPCSAPTSLAPVLVRPRRAPALATMHKISRSWGFRILEIWNLWLSCSLSKLLLNTSHLWSKCRQPAFPSYRRVQRILPLPWWRPSLSCRPQREEQSDKSPAVRRRHYCLLARRAARRKIWLTRFHVPKLELLQSYLFRSSSELWHPSLEKNPGYASHQGKQTSSALCCGTPWGRIAAWTPSKPCPPGQTFLCSKFLLGLSSPFHYRPGNKYRSTACTEPGQFPSKWIVKSTSTPYCLQRSLS